MVYKIVENEWSILIKIMIAEGWNGNIGKKQNFSKNSQLKNLF